MTYTQGVNVSESPKRLVSVKLHQDHWHLLLHLVVMLQNSEHCFGHIVHHHVQVDFVWLIPLGVESMLQSDHIGVEKLLHYLQFSILVPLVLIHLLDGNRVTVLVHRGLEYHAKRTIAYNTVCIVGKTCGLLVLFPTTFHCFVIHF